MIAIARKSDRRGAARGRCLWQAATAAGLLGLLLWPLGCSLQNKGGPGDNHPPEVFLVNVPPDSTSFNESPLVYWYGTDDDGRILRYDYTVVLKSTIDSISDTLPGVNLPSIDKFIAFVLTDKYPRWISIYPDSVAQSNQERVKLYASPFVASCDTVTRERRDPHGVIIPGVLDTFYVNCVSGTVPQYMFIRAIDDRGASSKIKYRTYSRRNHWPETVISAGFDQYAQYMSLPKLSETYSGIRLAWGGSDRLDVRPPARPDLTYYWRVYGPFSQQPSLGDTIGMEPIFASLNPNPIEGVWVKDTVTIVYDLWRQKDSRSDPLNDTTRTRTGWFMVAVTARDDAFIPSVLPAMATFQAIFPRFERKVLMVDDTWYGPECAGTATSNPKSPTYKVNQAFLKRMLKAVYPESDTLLDWWWRSKEPQPGELCVNRPQCGNMYPLEMLAQHRLVIHVSDDVFDPLSGLGKNPPVQLNMRRYLDAGGMIWLITRSGLIQPTGIGQNSPSKMFQFCGDSITNPDYNALGCRYFDIPELYYPAWRLFAIPLRQSGEKPIAASSNDEFIGGRLVASGSDLPPALEIDPARVKDSLYINALTRQALINSGVNEIPGVPDVNFFARGSLASPLYVFQSWRPNGPIPPENRPSFSQDKLVAVRMVGPSRTSPLFKTAYFSFPLFFIKEEQTRQLFIKMVDWFFLPFAQS